MPWRDAGPLLLEGAKEVQQRWQCVGTGVGNGSCCCCYKKRQNWQCAPTCRLLEISGWVLLGISPCHPVLRFVTSQDY